MKPDFVLLMYDLYLPLYGGINFQIFNFYSRLFFQRDTEEYFWLKDNAEMIEKLEEIDDIAEAYADLDDIRENLDLDRIDLSEKLSVLSERTSDFSTPISVQTGGEDIIKIIVVSIAFYLFSPGHIDSSYLPKPAKMGIKNGGTVEIKNYSGDNYEARVVLLIGVNGKKYFVKITPNVREYQNEKDIYEELKTYDNIIKIYHSGLIDVGQNDSPILIKLDNIAVDVNQEGEKYSSQIINLKNNNYQGTFILYYVLEYCEDYISSRDAYQIIINMHNAGEKICKLMGEMIQFLYHLNKNLGFVHWDLHSLNILINPTTMRFKFFDFDMSVTTKIQNNTFFSSMEEYYEGVIPKYIKGQRKSYKIIGFIWDCLRIFEGVYRADKDIECDNLLYFDQLKTAIRNMGPLKPTYFVNMQGTAITLYENGFYNKFKDLGGGGVNYYTLYKKYREKYTILKKQHLRHIS